MPVTAQDIVSLALKHVGEAYRLGARVPMASRQWTGPWDCAEFASWCLYRATGVLYGVRPENDPVRADAYSGWWIDQARRDGATVPLDVAIRTPGAFLLRAAGKDWIGHVAISDGKGGTVEAHSSKTGVIRGKVEKRRWDHGVVVPGVMALSNPEVPRVQVAQRTLHVTEALMAGPLVRQVQRALRSAGYFPGVVDGIYGPQTAHAVQRYQDDHGLVADGEVGPATLKSMKIAVPDWARALVGV